MVVTVLMRRRLTQGRCRSPIALFCRFLFLLVAEHKCQASLPRRLCSTVGHSCSITLRINKLLHQFAEFTVMTCLPRTPAMSTLLHECKEVFYCIGST